MANIKGAAANGISLGRWALASAANPETPMMPADTKLAVAEKHIRNYPYSCSAGGGACPSEFQAQWHAVIANWGTAQ